MPAPSFGVIISEIRHTHNADRTQRVAKKDAVGIETRHRGRSATKECVQPGKMGVHWHQHDGGNGPSAGFRISSPCLASVCHALNWRQLTARGALPMGKPN